MSTPPIAGPSNRQPWKEIRLSASPAASCSRGSNRGMNVRDAGPLPATKHDCTTRIASTPPTGNPGAALCATSSTEHAACATVITR